MAEEKELPVAAEGGKMRPVDVILSMLTYGSKEDWELGMEKMKRRPFLEEDMEKVLKVISREATPAKGKPKAEADLAEWSQGLAASVTKVKKLAEDKHTSLYQATELLKISRLSFDFVCSTLKSSFNLSDECVECLKAFDEKFKRMIRQRSSDVVDEPEIGLEECLETLRGAIEVAKRERAAFEAWKSKGTKDASGTDSSRDEMNEIVGSEKTELEVIKSYCEKDVRKIHDGVEQLKEKLKEANADREASIERLAAKLTGNRDRQAALQEELQQLKQKERELKEGIDTHKAEQKRAEEEFEQSKRSVGRTQEDIEQLLAKTETSLTIIDAMGDVAKKILDRAFDEQAKLRDDTVRFNLATLRELRRALLVEMTVRQQHMDDRTDVMKSSTARLAELDKELKEARKKNFRARIDDINRQKETYTTEKKEAAEELQKFETRQLELEAKLTEVDDSLKNLDPSTPLPAFGDLYKSFQAKYDKAFEDGCEGITFVAEDA